MTNFVPIKRRSKEWRALDQLAFRYFDGQGIKWDVCSEEAKHFARESSNYLTLRAQELVEKGNTRD